MQNTIKPFKQTLDGQVTHVNFECTTCNKIISQSEGIRHLELNHDVFFKRV